MPRPLHILPLLLVLCLAAASAALGASPCTRADIEAALDQRLVDRPPELLGTGEDLPVSVADQWIAEVYHILGLCPIWVTPQGPGPEAQALVTVLGTAGLEGLDPRDYRITDIAALWRARSPEALADLDILLTMAFLGYVHDTTRGRIRAQGALPAESRSARRSPWDPLEVINQAFSLGDMHAFLESLVPRHRWYRSLRQQLAFYRGIRSSGGWPQVPPGPSIRPGSRDRRIPALRSRLAMTGDLDAATPPEDPELADEAFVKAVQHFQMRHGIEQDGIVGPHTLATLNEPVDLKIRRIIINMERWRWMAHDLGSRYVLADIAGFDLKAVDQDKIILDMPVIVGKERHETPVFSDMIRYLVINPYWNVTPTIARNEILPRLRANPRYLAENHMRLFSGWGSGARELNPMEIDWNQVSRARMGRYKIRQDPGPWNALGRLKFVFPNKENIYLHDTPSKGLFTRPSRAFSHGCVRVGRPVELAVFLLGEEQWSAEAIRQRIATGQRQVVRLSLPVPVHIVYRSVWVDGDGAVHFSRDPYKRDKALMRALFPGTR